MRIVLALIVFFISSAVSAQFPGSQPIRSKEKIPFVICPAGNAIHHHYIPAQKRISTKNSVTTFEVTYDGNVPFQAKDALEKGILPIIKGLFDTPVPVRISLKWEQLAEGVLGGASPGAYYSAFANAPNPRDVYPVALAEKIARFNLNPIDEADIVIRVSNNVDWFYNYLAPSSVGNRFDFTTIILHEILHGLGFTAAVGVDSGLGIINGFSDNKHSVYVDFLYNLAGTKITTVQDNSVLMGNELQSSNLYFNLITRGERIKLFAPPVFNPGSSVAHMDESTYNSAGNALMTPFTNRGEVLHDPGLAMEMMYDMGWDMLYMIHAPQAGKEDFNQATTLEVDLISDSPVESGSFKFHYSADGFANMDSVLIPKLDTITKKYSVTLPAPGKELTYTYYFEAKNSRNIKFTNPGQAPINSFTYKYSLDKIKPVISYDFPGEVSTVDSSLTILAKITDEFLGVDSAFVIWSFNGVDQIPLKMVRQSGFTVLDITNNYKAVMVFPGGPPKVTDVIRYRIYARDKSVSKNDAQAPVTGTYLLAVVPVQNTKISYVNDFNVTSNDFNGTGFRITQPAEFSNPAIHSSHPYPESGDGQFTNFTYELKTPITIQSKDPLIEFDEIVLVEPSDPGTSFGQDEFWDYVIVEGKKVGSQVWLPFLDGYDCRDEIAWLNAYNNGIPAGGQNSAALGTPNMFKKRIVSMVARGNFKAGDDIFIRFRLFSDPFAAGWGWAIDNLRIQDVQTAVEDFVLEENFEIIPNPAGDEQITIALDMHAPSEKIEIAIHDLLGRRVYIQQVSNPEQRFRTQISTNQLQSGTYIVSVRFNNKDVIVRKLVKH